MDFRGMLMVAFLAFIAFVAAQDEEDLEQDDVYFKVKKQEGDVTFGRKGKSGKKRDLNKGGFSIKLHKVGQIDSRGKDVGRPPQSFKYTATRFNKSASFQGVKAATIKLVSYLKDQHANISVKIFIFKEEGNITFGDEAFAVQKGSIKFILKVENFPFCDGRRNDSLCKTNETAEYFQIVIVVRTRKEERGQKESDEDKRKREGPPQPDDKKKRLRCFKGRRCLSQIFRFGNSELGISNQTEVDGEFKSMPSGFPKFMEQGGVQRFIFRGPRFNRTIMFDPVVDLEEDDDDDDGDKDRASSIHLNVFLIVACLAALFM